MSALTIPGVDYSFSRPAPAQLRAQGMRFAMRYLSDHPGKNLTAGELAALTHAGLKVGVVWENGARDMLLPGVGAAHARRADAQARTLGLGAVPICFAADFDANDSDKPAIARYLAEAAGVLGHGRVGVYGGYWVVKYCAEHAACSWLWQTYAWSGGLVHQHTDVWQFHNGPQIDNNKATPAAFDALMHPVKRPGPGPITRARWRSNVRVLTRIIRAHVAGADQWPPATINGLRDARAHYQRALAR